MKCRIPQQTGSGENVKRILSTSTQAQVEGWKICLKNIKIKIKIKKLEARKANLSTQVEVAEVEEGGVYGTSHGSTKECEWNARWMGGLAASGL